MSRGHVGFLLATPVLALLLGAWSCDKPAPPAGGPSGVPVPPPVPLPAITSLRIDGPSSLVPSHMGPSTQFKAIATRGADGKDYDVTAMSVWRVEGSSVRSSSPGRMSASGLCGGAVISAAIDGFAAEIHVLVSEACGYTLSGQVRAAETGGPLRSAIVVITAGTGRGVSAGSDDTGHFTINGAAGLVELRTTLEGFEPLVQQIVVSDHDARIDLALVPTVPTTASLAGDWILSISAAGECRVALPEIARERRYDATITQESAQLRLTIVGPSIRDKTMDEPGSFAVDGIVDNSAVRLRITMDTDLGSLVWSDFEERLSASEVIGLFGMIRGDVTSPSEIRGTLDGGIQYTGSARPVLCRGRDHGIVIQRK